MRCGLTEANTSHITNAIDMAQAQSVMLDRLTARQLLALPAEAVIVGAMGRLVPLKGHAALIEAFAQVCNEFPDSHLAILGEGRERENLEQLLTEHHVKDRVHLLGFKEDGLKYLKAFDIWTMPSFKEGLGFGLA